MKRRGFLASVLALLPASWVGASPRSPVSSDGFLFRGDRVTVYRRGECEFTVLESGGMNYWYVYADKNGKLVGLHSFCAMPDGRKKAEAFASRCRVEMRQVVHGSGIVSEYPALVCQ